MKRVPLLLSLSLALTALAGCESTCYEGKEKLSSEECIAREQFDSTAPPDTSSGDEDTSDGTDSGGSYTDFDRDRDGETDGYEDPVIHVGAYLYLHISILPAGVEDIYLYGYGFTGEMDWCDSLHVMEWVVDDNGEYWARIYLVDYGDEYRVNAGTEEACLEDDYTAWAYLEGEARDDELAWQNESDGTWALCLSVYDGEISSANCDNNDDD